MKKRAFSFFLVLCMMVGLLPAVLANESSGAAGSDNFKVERTETGLKSQWTLQGVQDGDSLWAIVLEETKDENDARVPGKMTQCQQITDITKNPVTITLNVSDTDFVRLIWLDKNFVVRDCKYTYRPTEESLNMSSGIQEADEADFDTQVMNLLHPGFLNASAEMALEEAAETDPYAYKRLIVSSSEKLPSLSAYGDPLVIYNPSTGYSIVQFADEDDAKKCAKELSALPYVNYVEPDILIKSGPKSSEDFLNADSSDFLSWGVKQMKADVLAAALAKKNGTSPVVVAVADTGAQMDHPFLKDRLTDNGFDFIENDKIPQDQHSHGTHVAGTIIDCTPGLNIKIMPVRVLGATGGGTAAGIAMGIRYAVKNGAQVINLSLGGGHSNYLDDAIKEALDSDVTVVVAAGNEGNNVMDHCPAHILDAITVGAVNSDRKKASFSNYGESLDIAAPGVGIKSSVLKGEYGQKNGTSMASPHIAAAAALLKYGYPDKTPAEIQQALKDTAIDLGDAGWDKDYGYGFPNLEAFVDKWPVDNHTYELFEDGLTWEDAKAKCEEKGGHLMTVTSEAEQKILESLLADGKKNNYWLGGYRDTKGMLPDSDTATFKWITNEAFSYANWNPGQPDNAYDSEDKLMAYRSNGKWNDLNPDGTCKDDTFYGLSNIGYICEWDGPKPPQEPEKEHTYEVFDTGMVWDDAKAYCEKLGGHLMTVTSAEEQAKLEELLQYGGKNSYWLGATRDTKGMTPDSAGGTFKWITNEAFSYANWASGQPDTHHGTENTLMVYRNANPAATSKLGEWNDLDADGTCQEQEFFGLNNFGFICEWDGDKPEPAEPGIFAVLYTDGELVFQNDNKPRQKKDVLDVYPVDGAILSGGEPIHIDYRDGSTSEEMFVDYADWYSNRKKITKVSIVNRIQPTSTALWFHGCENLQSVSGLEYLDTSKVENMSHMFSDCYQLTELDLKGFDTSNVTNMSHMFYGCDNLVNVDVSSFDTSKVTDMGSMFADSTALHRVYATEKFVVSAVTNDKNMFRNCNAIEGTYGTTYSKDHVNKEYARLDDNAIPHVKPGYLTDKRVDPGKANVYIYSDGEMVFQRWKEPAAGRTVLAHYEIEVLDPQNFSDKQALWYANREKVTTVTFADIIRPFAVSQWFYGFKNLTKINNIQNLDTRAVTDMSLMFSGCSALKTLDVSKFITRKVTSMKEMFKDCAALTSLNIGNFDTANVTDMSGMFQGCSGLTTLDVNKLNTAKVTTMSNMFRDCSALTALDLSSFDTASLKDMSYMFRDCKSMKTLNVSKFNTANVPDMKYLFSGCASLTALDLSSFNTAKVTDMQYMFSGCAALSTLDVSKFDTGNVTTMSNMFRGVKGLKTLNVSSFKTNKVTDMSGMFAETGLTALDLHTFNTANVTTMNGMFQSSSALKTLDLTEKENTAWNTAKVTDTENMFRDCSALTTINVALNTFPTDAVTNSGNMFTGSAKLVGGRGTAYDASHVDKEYARIDFGKRSPGYFTDPNMVVLTFNPNGDSEDPVSGTMEEQLFSKGVEDTLYKNQFTREGYTFKGWNTKADGSGKAYADEGKITLLSDLTLYAQWEFTRMEKLYAILYSDGELVFQWNDKAAAGRTVVKTYVADWSGYTENRGKQDNYRAWHNEASQIKTVTFAKRIQPDDTAQWFQDCVNLTTIRNLEKLDTSLVVDMSMMFDGCASLTKLNLSTFDTSKVGTNELEGNFNAMFEGCAKLVSVDLSSFNTANVTAMKDMFSGCESLTTIYASDKFVTAQVTGNDGRNMFMDCLSLVGGNGTKFDDNETNVSYAHIDGGASNPGYFTKKDIGMT